MLEWYIIAALYFLGAVAMGAFVREVLDNNHLRAKTIPLILVLTLWPFVLLAFAVVYVIERVVAYVA